MAPTSMQNGFSLREPPETSKLTGPACPKTKWTPPPPLLVSCSPRPLLLGAPSVPSCSHLPAHGASGWRTRAEGAQRTQVPGMEGGAPGESDLGRSSSTDGRLPTSATDFPFKYLSIRELEVSVGVFGFFCEAGEGHEEGEQCK